jgi:hypothetical protein
MFFKRDDTHRQFPPFERLVVASALPFGKRGAGNAAVRGNIVAGATSASRGQEMRISVLLRLSQWPRYRLANGASCR